jgi:hypothetical protein
MRSKSRHRERSQISEPDKWAWNQEMHCPAGGIKFTRVTVVRQKKVRESGRQKGARVRRQRKGVRIRKEKRRQSSEAEKATESRGRAPDLGERKGARVRSQKRHHRVRRKKKRQSLEEEYVLESSLWKKNFQNPKEEKAARDRI